MKYLPTFVYTTIYEIDFTSLYASGKKIILSDLDNTIASYKEETPSEEAIKFNEKLRELGFKIYLVSNNNDKRIKKYSEKFIIDGYLAKAKKPFVKKLEAFVEKNHLKKSEIIAIGDQLVTDILGFNKLAVDTVLVKTIDQKNQKWYTKINRLREQKILKKIKKVDCIKYNKIKEFYE